MDHTGTPLTLLPAAPLATMQRVCAWCHTVMAPGTLPATHGICPTCAQKLEG